MGKMFFSNADTRAIFENGNCTFEAFNELMKDVACGKAIFNNDGKEMTKDDANKAIRRKMYEVLGLEEGTKGRDLRRAIRRHKVDVFEVIETTVEDMLVSGWGNNPFFNEFVEIKNGANGDINEFYTEDKVILTVSELSGNHHNFWMGVVSSQNRVRVA